MKNKQKAKVLATLFTAATIVASPITINYDGFDRSFSLSGTQAEAASISLLGNTTLQPTYANGKLIIQLQGTQIANIGLLQNYHPYFKLPDELKTLLSNPAIKANSSIAYDIPYLGAFGLQLSNDGTVTGNALLVDAANGTIGANIPNGLGLSLAGLTTFTLTIDLAALGVVALPAGIGDDRLDFTGRVGDDFFIGCGFVEF